MADTSLTYNAPDDSATVPTYQSLIADSTGDLTLVEFYVDGDLKLSWPQGAEWSTSSTPAQLGIPGGAWTVDQEYTWYIRYLSHYDDKTWNGSSWEFSGNLTYETLAERSFTVGDIEKLTPADGSTATYGDNVTLDWVDNGTGATKYRWTLSYDYLGGSSFGGTVNAPTTEKDVTANIQLIFDRGSTEATWIIQPYIAGEYLDDYQGEWTININPPLPEKPITPSPIDTGTDVTLDHSQITWEDGGYTDTYNVYFGVSGSEVLQSSAQAGLTWTIPFGTLDYNTTYGWRIDASNVTGTTTGDTWTFTTLSFAPPVPSATNTLSIIKRLVAAAANKIWYESI